MLDLRWYQAETIDAVDDFLRSDDGHGVVSLPTAAGKTVIFATMVKRWLNAYPGSRVAILAHREELLTQAEAKIRRVWPGAPTGIYSASVGRRDRHHDILIGGIQSVYARASEFRPFDVVIVDEAHLVPNNPKSMYRRFLNDCWRKNPSVRFVGFTATPYRLDGGPLCGEGKLFNRVVYEADISRLIDDGFLCPLRTKETDTQMDVAGVSVRNGDYVESQLQAKVDTEDAVSAACDEIVAKAGDRNSWLVFCAGVAHAHHVSDALAKRGYRLPVVVGDTDKDERREILRAFDAGEIRGVVNVNCLTTGLDVTRIDTIAVLRPTQSTSLWVQMVGRGFRLDPAKADTLVLDFGGNARRHGPLNALKIRTKGEGGEAPVKTCPACKEVVPAAAASCPCCGHEFPPREQPDNRHEGRADTAPIIVKTDANKSWEFDVEQVTVGVHQKAGSPPSLRVHYYGKFDDASEWVCLEHEGYAGDKARKWWFERFGLPIPATAAEAAGDMFLGHKVRELTASLRVRRDGKYTQVVKVNLKSASPVAAVAR